MSATVSRVAASGVAASGVADSAVTDSAVTDSAVTNSAVADSGVVASGVAASGVADSAVTDSAVTDSGVVASGVAASGVADSGGAAPGVVTAVPQSGPLPVPLVLGLQEGRRIVRHPIALAGLTLMTVLVVLVSDNGSRDAFEVVSTGPTFFYGVFTYFAANLVASRDRRAHSGELLAALPAPRAARVAALCVGALVPTALCAAFVAAVHGLNLARDLYVVSPDLWHLAQGPLTVLGGALLGIMVARWTSIPGVALLVMIAMFAFNVWVTNHDAPVQALGTFVSWAVWAPHAEWVGMEPGSPAWHAVYLAALCALAACGSFLREVRNPWRVVAVGLPVTAVVAVAAVAQLP